MIRLNKKKLFTTSVNSEISEELISEIIKKHKTLVDDYLKRERMYMSNHDVLNQAAKEPWKPDNRLVLNYAKYIVDTFGGYHLGAPLKVSHEDDIVSEYIKQFRKLNDMEDSEYELAKIVDIYGHGFIYLYQDEEGNTRMTYNNPINMCIIHDDSIQERPMYAVRYSYDDNNIDGYGELLSDNEVVQFVISNTDVRITDRETHVYSKLPVVEMILNDERQGIFDSVITLIDALNKAVSEKANDVDYFADAYLKIVGTELNDDVANNIRDSRIINLWGESAGLDAAFLDKPNSDTTQQNLIALLKESIFAISMVANLSETDFGNASGTALAFKLQAMSNLAKTKDRKMQSALNRMFEVVMSVPMTQVPADAWREIEYQFTRNVPRNLLEEAQVVNQLDGKVSDSTKLKVLSIVDDIQDELDKLDQEKEKQSQFMVKSLSSGNQVDNGVMPDE